MPVPAQHGLRNLLDYAISLQHARVLAPRRYRQTAPISEEIEISRVIGLVNNYKVWNRTFAFMIELSVVTRMVDDSGLT